MNLLEIKTAVASYFTMPGATQVTVADLTVNGIDLFLVAANQAKQTASQLHDFGFQRKLVDVMGDSVAGFDFSTLNVKTVVDILYKTPQGAYAPMEWTTAEESQERQRQENRYHEPYYRYPTDAQCHSEWYGQQRLELRGDRAFFYRSQLQGAPRAVTIGLDAYVFDADWTMVTSAVTDTWTTRGSQYIMWQCICDLNNYFKSFVPRQEGNVAVPQERAATALQAFIDWDVFKYEQGRRHGR